MDKYYFSLILFAQATFASVGTISPAASHVATYRYSHFPTLRVSHLYQIYLKVPENFIKKFVRVNLSAAVNLQRKWRQGRKRGRRGPVEKLLLAAREESYTGPRTWKEAAHSTAVRSEIYNIASRVNPRPLLLDVSFFAGSVARGFPPFDPRPGLE